MKATGTIAVVTPIFIAYAGGAIVGLDCNDGRGIREYRVGDTIDLCLEINIR